MFGRSVYTLLSVRVPASLVWTFRSGITAAGLMIAGTGHAAEYPSPVVFDRMLSLCAAGAGIELDADLRGSIVGLYESDRTEGTATLDTTADFLSSIPESDRLKAYEIYTRCITEILAAFAGQGGSETTADPLELGPTRTSWSAQFANWPAAENEHGSYGPTSDRAGASFAIRPNGNTWLGPPSVTVKPIDGDFQADVAFHIPSRGDKSLRIGFGQTGSGDRTSLEFYISRWAAGQPTFGVSVFTLQGIYVTSNRQVVEREPLPIASDQLDWNRSAILSVRRVGARVGVYLNDILLNSFDAPAFRISQVSVSAAFPGEIRISSFSVHEPR